MSTASTMGTPQILQTLPAIFTTFHEAKIKKGLRFDQIAEALGRDEWYTAAIFYGQAKPEPADLDKLSQVLDIRRQYLEDALGTHFFPHRGLGDFPPKDPVIYRLFEALMVYAHPLKHLIHEKFGDGIMSAIDFTGNIERIEDPAGDRVRITMSGKFLPYKRW